MEKVMSLKVEWNKKCYVKVYEYRDDILVAICDEEVLGKTFSNGKIYFKVSEEFYGGFKVTLKEALKYVKQGTIINAVGENVIKLLAYLNEDILDAVIWIGKVPHVQVVK